DGGRRKFQRLDETYHAQTVQAGTLGFLQLLEQHAEIRSELPESAVWRCGDQADGLCLRLSAKSGPQLLVGLSLGQHVQRHRQRTFCLWHERRSDWTGLQEKH